MIFLTRASIHGCMSTETTPYPFPPTYPYPITSTHPTLYHPHPHPKPPTHPYPITTTHPYPIPPTYPYPMPPTHPYPNMLGVGRGSKIWCKANISPKLNYRHLVCYGNQCLSRKRLDMGGGGPPVHVASPTGASSFILTYIFAEKCSLRRSDPSQRGQRPRQQKILDPPLHHGEP